MLGTQIIWCGIPFGAIPGNNTFLPVQDFRLSTAIKTETDEETGVTKTTGRELQEACFSIRVQSIAGADPRITFELLDALRGKSAGIYLADGVGSTLTQSVLDKLQTSDWRQLLSTDTALDIATGLLFGTSAGNCKFVLTAVTMDAQGIDSKGNIYDALITLSFTEDAGQRQTGGLRVYINDKDITESIAVASCYYEQHAEGEADSLSITFSDTRKQWANWKPSAEGDTVRITDGALDSGKLYLDSLKPENGNYKLQAYSTPKSAFSVKSRSFDGISLPELARKIASDNGLTAKLYSVPETQCKYAQQRGQSDLAFLHAMCKRAGVSFIVYNCALCLYGEKQIESKEAAKTITLGLKDSYTVTDDKQAAYSSCELRNGTYTGTAKDSGVKTGKVYRDTVRAAWAGQADANAAAAARLRELNKGTKRAELTMSTQRQIAAGSVIRLVCTGWTGKAFVYRVRHDMQAKKSRIWVRKPIDY